MTELFGWHRLLNSLNIPLSVETVCVFTAPVFSVNASWATYLLTKVVFFYIKNPCTYTGLLKFFSNLTIVSLGNKGPRCWFDGSNYSSNGNCYIDYVFCLKNTRSLICLLDLHFFCSSILFGVYQE